MSRLIFSAIKQLSKRKNGYDLAVKEGYTGTESDWQASLSTNSVSISSTYSSFGKNLRNTDSQTIPFTVSVSNYTGTLTISCSNANVLFSDGTTTSTQIVISIVADTTLSNYSAVIPYINNGESITITASLVHTYGTIEKTLVLSAYEIAKMPIELQPVNAYADLPTSVNKTTDSASINDALIYGDYIIIKYLTLTPSSTTVAVDEFGASVLYSSNTTYYTRSDNTFTVVTISQFTVGTTYYSFRPYPWKYSGSDWYRTDESEIKIKTLNEVVEYSKQNALTDPNTNYSDYLVAYDAYIQNLTVGVLNVGNIFANDIESTNYTEDTDTSSSTYGSPLSGYALKYEGGEDAKGQIKSYGGVFNDMTVRGSLNMYARDGVNEGANILHPALTTVAGSAGDTSGGATVSAINNSWNSSTLYNHSGITANSILSASGKIDLTTSITQCLRLTNTSATYIAGNSYSTRYLIYSDMKIPVTRLQTSYAQNLCIMNAGGTSIAGLAVYVNNSKIYEYAGVLNIYGQTVTVQIPASGSIYITSLDPERDNDRGIQYKWLDLSFSNAGFSQGFYVYYSSAWHNLGTSSTISNPLYLTSPVSFYDSGHYQIPTNFLNYSGGTVSMTEGVPYRITSSNLLYNTTSIIGKFFTKNGDGSRNLIYTDSNGENQASITLSSSTYVYMSGTIVVSATEAGVEMKGQYPVAHNTYDIGTSSKVWKTGYFMDVIANGNSLTSAREKKENIVDYTDSALSLIDQTKIVNFSYKEDANHVKHIGFIADDTPKELSGEKQNMMVVGDCIGVLIKAVQELNNRCINLQSEIDALKS